MAERKLPTELLRRSLSIKAFLWNNNMIKTIAEEILIRAYLFIILIILCSTSCQKGFILVYNGPSIIEFGGEESSTVITFNASRHWRVIGTEPWLSFSQSSGSGSDSQISVILHCDQNTTYENRSCSFTISINGMRQRIYVNQAANEGILAIDIGLPVLWASCNLGATKPWEIGNYYAWGEIEPKSDYSWDSYKWNRYYKDLTKYNYDESFGTIDNKLELESMDDAAHFLMGGKWRTPTQKDYKELLATRNNSKYKWEFKSVHGQLGWEILYLPKRKSIFFPLTGEMNGQHIFDTGKYGHYWSSSLCESGFIPIHAWLLDFWIEIEPRIIGLDRARGYPIRAVTE